MTTPLARLKAFRTSWNDDDLIDEDSGLTAADLDAVIADADRLVDVPKLEDVIEPRDR